MHVPVSIKVLSINIDCRGQNICAVMNTLFSLTDGFLAGGTKIAIAMGI
jgi:hypothetical protein